MNLLTPVLLTSCLALSNISAQTPQFAVVKPNGTTQIYSTWSLAYAASVNEDFIYLPGTVIPGPVSIDKRIHVFGAGHHPDSTSSTGKTIINGNLNITSGASGGTCEGLRVTSTVSLGGSTKLTNYTIQRCYFLGAIQFINTSYDSVPENCTISETILSKIVSNNSNVFSRNNLFIKNLFTGSDAVSGIGQSVFSNNIFTYNGYVISSNVNYCIFQNNIFLVNNPIFSITGNTICYNSYLHNIKLSDPDFYSNPNCPSQAEEGNISVPNVDSIFISYVSPWDYVDNLHLKPTCPAVGAGTDGTDLGIYGTNNPTPAGWVPRNPHIYFKQVNSETGSDGKLHIQVGVRANNN